jgi:hypothetical protein
MMDLVSVPVLVLALGSFFSICALGFCVIGGFISIVFYPCANFFFYKKRDYL